MKFWRTPLDAGRTKSPRGRVHILIDRCKGCGFCIKYCPRQVLEFSEAFNRKGYHPPVVVRLDDCADCELCELMCPEFAIWVTPEDGGDRPEGERAPSYDDGTEDSDREQDE